MKGSIVDKFTGNENMDIDQFKGASMIDKKASKKAKFF